MARPKLQTMTIDEFFAWQERQDERYELVDGVPVPLRMMTGASNVHDVIAVNVIVALGNQLRGSPCRVATADTAVRTSINGLRRPDVTVECAPPERHSYEARAPKLVVEILSPTTRRIDQIRKVEEYKRLPTLAHIVLIEPEAPRLLVLTRQADGAWLDETFEELEAIAPLSALGASLALADVYDRIVFEAPPDPDA